MSADHEQFVAALNIASPAVVTIANGSAAPVERTLLPPYAVIGRDPASHIRLDDPSISGRHALLLQIEHAVFCTDLGSRTGVHTHDSAGAAGWLDRASGARIGPYILSQRDAAGDGSPPTSNPLHDRLPDVDPPPVVSLETPGFKGRTFLLNRRLTILGRGAPARVQLRDCPDISRAHCAILVTARGVWVIDLQSRTGARIDGREVTCSIWHPGEVLELGRHRLRLQEPERGGMPAPATPAAASPPADVTELGRRLIRNQLLSEFQWEQACQETQPASVAEAVEQLVTTGGLTAWQAERLSKSPEAALLLDERYVLQRMISRGGMATVYEARDVRTRQRVAVKVPRRVEPLESNRRRFLREIAINARLDHGHIVRMRDVGPDGRFLVLDFVDGSSLKEIVQASGPQTAPDVVRWMIQIAQALEHAHARAVVHRDVKPSNVLIDVDGWARLIDMGLARVTDEACDEADDDEYQAGLTTAGQKLGTVQYMPPEQASGHAGTDVRSDVYGLGATMYTLLAGRPPFGDRKTIAEVLLAHLRDEPPAIANIDPDLFAIVMTAMAKDPSDRYPSPSAMAAALADWQRLARKNATETVEQAAQRLAEDRRQFEADVSRRECELSVREQQLDARAAKLEQFAADQQAVHEAPVDCER